MGGRRPLVHILNALCLVNSAAGVEVDFQVAQRFECHFQLQVLGGCDVSRCSHAVGAVEPSSFKSLVEIALTSESEGEVETRSHGVAGALSEHVANAGNKSRYGHRLLVAVRDVDVSNHHEHPCRVLQRVVPPLLLERFLCYDRELDGRCVEIANDDGVVVLHLIFYVIRPSVYGLGGHDESFAVFAVSYCHGSVSLELYFLLESIFVQWQFSVLLLVFL